MERRIAGEQHHAKDGYHTYYQSAKEGKSRYSRLATEMAPLVRELPLFALSMLSLRIWAPILVAVTLLAAALDLGRPL